MIVAAAAVGAWCVAAASPATATALVVAGLLQAARLARWAGYRTWRNPLVLVLHVAYAFLPIGFLLVGASALSSIPLSAGIHAWTGGAFGGMTIAVMSRASLGTRVTRSSQAGPSRSSTHSSLSPRSPRLRRPGASARCGVAACRRFGVGRLPFLASHWRTGGSSPRPA